VVDFPKIKIEDEPLAYEARLWKEKGTHLTFVLKTLVTRNSSLTRFLTFLNSHILVVQVVDYTVESEIRNFSHTLRLIVGRFFSSIFEVFWAEAV